MPALVELIRRRKRLSPVRLELSRALDDEIIDAIAALRDASPVVKLLDFTARSSQSKMEISLADIDLSDYRELWIYPKFSASTTEGAVRKSISATHIGNTSASPAESHL